MERNASNRQSFTYELSAFLTAARSVLQYLHRECSRLGDAHWYDSNVADPTLRFFKDRRDLNIHARPVEPDQAVAIDIEETISIGESFSITTTDEEGNVLQHREVKSPAVERPATKVALKYEYYFSPNGLDVLTLCDKYLKALDTILNDWEALKSTAGTATRP